MCIRELVVFGVLLLATRCTNARSLLDRGSEEDSKPKPKPVACAGPPPQLNNATWPADCKDAPKGFACKGKCDPGFNAEPTAVCQKQGAAAGWRVNGGCKPAECDDDKLPVVANAKWDNCHDIHVGGSCTAKCVGLYTESAPIVSSCTASTQPRSEKAVWSTPTAFCGLINSQALLTFQAAAPSCTQTATDTVKSSVTTYMQGQTGVNSLQVSVTCYNADGSVGGTARRRLQDTGSIQFVVLVVYVGGEQAATALVDTAQTDLNQIGGLIANVTAATGNTITVQQTGTTGSVSGGGTTPQQNAQVTLLRSGSGPNVQTSTGFFLTAIYTGPSGTQQGGVAITGPSVDPAGAVTCTPATPSSTTDALGTATWSCTTGTTPGLVTISVTAPNPTQGNTVSASVQLTIGTDCVGAFGPPTDCSNVCGAGTNTTTYQITTPAANGGRPCPYDAGYSVTQTCTGPTTCDVNAACTTQGCKCSAGYEGTGETCTQCAAGTWQDGSFSTCQQCPPDFTTAHPGATSNISCTNCQTPPTLPAGATLVTDGNSCPLPGDYNQVCTATCAAGLTSTVAATCRPTWQVTGCCVPATFDTYALGSIGPALTAESYAGQQGWTTTDNFPKSKCRSDNNAANIWDQEVKDVQFNGNTQRVWRMSNAVSTYGFSACPCSYSACKPAGESGTQPQAALWNDRGPTGCGPDVNNYGSKFGAYATSSQFSWLVDFRSATGAAQANLHIELCSVARQSSWRQTYLRIVDTGAGFDLRVKEMNATAGATYTLESDGAVTTKTLTVASGLSYTDTHTLETRVYFVDGISTIDGQYVGNDIVEVYLNGTLIHTGSTFEALYMGWQTSLIVPPRKQAVDALMFRTEKPSQTANLGQGFYFSRVVTTNPPAKV